MRRSARPGVAATNTTVSPRARAAFTSAIQSGRRPEKERAGWEAIPA